jgi:uncharacterized protein YyaL (SSP411 family)
MPNKLIEEKSPYLLQHAHNPVDWHPWSVEAFDAASRMNRPIFLSIGYSTCHWCHVMETESFKDPAVAHMLNNLFMCIKVDREERPDIDHLYMTVCQLMTGTGGWPLTIIMTPDKIPFFAGTYIPKTDQHGRLGLLQLIPQIEHLWRHNRDEIERTAGDIKSLLSKTISPPEKTECTKALIHSAYEDLQHRFDPVHGGFGSAPKFPQPQNIRFLIHYWWYYRDQHACAMAEKTLQAMRWGGIYDHLGFGFHRYSTDAAWHVPHFEKMLYDQALLAIAYSDAFQATKKEEYRNTVQEILTYVIRDMTSPEQGFYTAEDADSNGKEGSYYLWDYHEIKDILKDDVDFFTDIYGIKPKSEHDMSNPALSRKDRITLSIDEDCDSLTHRTGLTIPEIRSRLVPLCQRLFEYRKKRTPPFKDDKILTDWNGLMIAAFARAGRILQHARYLEIASNAADFILSTLLQPNDILYHRFRNGDTAIAGTADDYSFFIWGLLELYRSTFQNHYIDMAVRLNKKFIDLFWDKTDQAGFYYTATDNKELPIRQRIIYDGALPSSNTIALLNLLHLARITQHPDLFEKAETIIQRFTADIAHNTGHYIGLIDVLYLYFEPLYTIAISDLGSTQGQRALHKINTLFLPHTLPLVEHINTPYTGTSVCTRESCQLTDVPVEEAIEYVSAYRTADSFARHSVQ